MADVCVVGAGPAGLTLARELSTAGLDVLVLEAGPGSPPAGGVDVTSTRNVGLPYDPAATRSAGVGGSSLRWRVPTPLGGGFVRLRELEPDDLDAVGGGPGWPLSYDVLRPFYARSRELLGMAGGAPAEALAGGPLERHVYSFVHRSVFTERLPAELRRAARVRLLPDTSATEVLVDPGSGEVLGLRARSLAGGDASVRARVYVLAAGAIENARLLLASRSVLAAGVGNGHDHVGRHFMEHPHFHSGVALPRPGAPDLETVPERWDVVVEDGHPLQRKYAVPGEVLRREGLLRAVYKVKAHSGEGTPGFGHDGTVPEDVVEAYAALRRARHEPGHGHVTASTVGRLLRGAPHLLRYAVARRSHARGAAATGQERFRVHVMAEQEPSPLSRVRLSAGTDRLGVPLAELDWRLTARDRTSIVRNQQLVTAALGETLGARVVSTLGPDGPSTPQGGAHHMGTTRMSARAQDGVVDPDCRVHGHRNLFVAGSSVFPVGGAANPTLTIVALALRLVEQLVTELRPVAGRSTASGCVGS